MIHSYTTNLTNHKKTFYWFTKGNLTLIGLVLQHLGRYLVWRSFR